MVFTKQNLLENCRKKIFIDSCVFDAAGSKSPHFSGYESSPLKNALEKWWFTYPVDHDLGLLLQIVEEMVDGMLLVGEGTEEGHQCAVTAQFLQNPKHHSEHITLIFTFTTDGITCKLSLQDLYSCSMILIFLFNQDYMCKVQDLTGY